MRILAIAQVEDSDNLEHQIKKQTIQPHDVVMYVDDKPAKGILNRRKRIAENHLLLMAEVERHNPDLVWQIEQDCVLPDDALERLLRHYQNLKGENFGYISGVQIGRHGIYAIGAWHVFEDEFYSADYRKHGLEQVDATGFYCLLAEREVWLNGNCDWNGEPYGPDVNWGLSLRELGYKIYIDHDLHIGHKVKNGIIDVDNISTCNVRFYNDNGKWRYKTTD